TGSRPPILSWDSVIIGRTDRGEVCICFVLLCTAEQYKAACFPSKTHTAHNVKHTQHTVNPLIAPDVNPFPAQCH
ncbi:unnamed protein product, partial [Staurois parvus]